MTSTKRFGKENQHLWRYWPFAVLILLPLLIYWPLTIGGRVLYWGVPLYQFYPWHKLVVDAVRSGRLPLWTELLGNGAPLLANHQSATFYPPNLVYFVSSVERAMGYSVVLHLILAGLFAFAWGRTIGLSRFAATVTGLSFALSGFLVSRTQFITIIDGAAWLPLIFLFAERVVRRRSPLDAIWLAIVIALQFLAGHAQLWFYSLWAVVAYVFARAWSLRRVGPEGRGVVVAQVWLRWRGLFILLTGSFILSLGLSAVQLLPTAELSLHSQRAGGLDPEEAMIYSFWPWRLLTLVVPDLFGSPATGDFWGYATYWEDAGYVGMLPLLLALSAVWAWGRRLLSALVRFPRSLVGKRMKAIENVKPWTQKVTQCPEDFLVPFFFVLILVSLVLAMGQNTPIYPLVFKYVPGFGSFRSPARVLLIYTFAVSALAGVGADRFRLTYRTQYVARLTAAGAAAMLAVSLVMGQLELPIKPTFVPAFARFAVWLGLSTILLLLCPVRAGPDKPAPDDSDPRVARSPLSRGVWRGLMICLIAIDLALFAAPLTPTIDPALYSTITDADRFLLSRADDKRLFATHDYDYNTKFSSYLGFSDWGPAEVEYWLSFRSTLAPNLNVFSRAFSVNNDDPLVVGRWRSLMDALRVVDWSARMRMLRTMNGGYVLAESPPPGLSPVENVSDLYRLPEPLTRAWMASQARLVADADNLLTELLAASFDPAAEVLLEPASSPALFGILGLGARSGAVDHLPSMAEPSPDSRPTSVSISLREEGNRRTIDVVASQPGYLVLAYTYYPGWRARVDGQSVEILRANYAFMALPLDAGDHHVVLDYRPVSFAMGALISGLSVLMVIAIALVVLHRPERGL